MTVLPNNKGPVKKLLHKYPSTVLFLLIYIALVVTATLVQVRYT